MNPVSTYSKGGEEDDEHEGEEDQEGSEGLSVFVITVDTKKQKYRLDSEIQIRKVLRRERKGAKI